MSSATAIHSRSYIKRDVEQARGYSQAVVTQGGRIVWLAGRTGGEDDAGQSLADDFEGQVRLIFSRLSDTLEKAQAKLSDLVSLTVYLTDIRDWARFVELRREILGDNFPASTLVSVDALVSRAARIEIQAVAVIAE